MNNPNKISEFYDDFIEYQLKNAFNERHFALFKYLKKFGLRSNSNILEIGCGIGIMTALISSIAKKGEITAIDISEKSIRVARERVVNKANVQFIVADVIKHNFKNSQFDFITLFDVIEHISISDHSRLFSELSRLMKQDSVLLINIPHPDYITFVRKHTPEELQIIDQSLPADFIINNAYSAGLNLILFKTYSIWKENDYQFIAFNKQKEFTNRKLTYTKSIVQKISGKLKKIRMKKTGHRLYKF